MITPSGSRLRFAPSWRLTLFAAFFLPVLASLAVWQWQSAAEAAAFEAHLAEMAAAPPKPLAEVESGGNAMDLQPVSLQGRFLPGPRIWLDNRTWRGRAGYELLVPFADAGMQQAVLVNLGWVAGGIDRSVLPAVHLPSRPVMLSGQLAPLRPPPAVFGPVLEALAGDLRVQRLELAELAETLGRPLYHRVVVADPMAAGVQTWNFRPVRLTADRHRGYALQFLGLGLVLVVGWCVASFRRDQDLTGE